MRLLVKLFYVFLAVSVLTSCTQRKYGQLTGFQWNKTKKTEKVASHRGHYVSPKSEVTTTETEVEEVALVEADQTPVKEVELVKEAPKVTKNEKVAIAKEILFDKSDKQAINAKTVFSKSNLKEAIVPTKKISKVAKKLKEHKSDEGLLYWILIILLIILLLTLIRKILGEYLYGILVLVLLILLILHLLGKI